MKKEDFVIDEWVIWQKNEHLFYLLINKIKIDKVYYSEYINVTSKNHSVSDSYYAIDDDSIKGLVDISEVKKYLPSNHPHHNKIKIKQVDDLEPLIKLLNNINDE